MSFDWGNFSAGIVSAGVDLGLGLVNLKRAKENDDANYAINMANYLHQREQFDYERAKQREAWNREDNAVQRRVADLKAAGINPLLAAGSSAGTSSPAPVNAPQMGRRDIADSLAAMENIRRMKMENAQIGMMFQEIQNKKQERKESEHRMKMESARLGVEEKALGLRERDVVVGESRHVLEEKRFALEEKMKNLEYKFQDASYGTRMSLLQEELKRAKVTVTSIDLDNQLRSLSIDIRKIDKQLKEIELDIKNRYGLNEAEAEYFTKLNLLKVARHNANMAERDDTWFDTFNLPSTVVLRMLDAVAYATGEKAAAGVSRIFSKENVSDAMKILGGVTE